MLLSIARSFWRQSRFTLKLKLYTFCLGNFTSGNTSHRCSSANVYKAWRSRMIIALFGVKWLKICRDSRAKHTLGDICTMPYYAAVAVTEFISTWAGRGCPSQYRRAKMTSHKQSLLYDWSQFSKDNKNFVMWVYTWSNKRGETNCF